MPYIKTYERINWENYPSDATPLNEQNLNKIDYATDVIDNRVIELDTTKFAKIDALSLVKTIELNRETGELNIIYLNGSVETIDTLLEKIAVNFDFDQVTQQLVIFLDEIDPETGENVKKYVDLSAFITPTEFEDSTTIGFYEVAGSVGNVVKADVLDGSITDNKLRPDYLAEIRQETAKSKFYMESSETSANNSHKYADDSESSYYKSYSSELNCLDILEQCKEILRQSQVEVEMVTFYVDMETGYVMANNDIDYKFVINETTGNLERLVTA